ncbi:MAG TPA: SRPBCC family protein [Acidimicrobiales bacterium]
MARYVAVIPSSWSIERTFGYMSDLSNARLWDPSVRSAQRRDDGEIVVGSTFDLSVRFAGRDTTLTYHVSEIEPSQLVVFTSTTPGLFSQDSLGFASRPEGCEMTYDASLRLRGAAGVLNPLLAVLFRRLGDRARDSLRSTLGGREQPRS